MKSEFYTDVYGCVRARLVPCHCKDHVDITCQHDREESQLNQLGLTRHQATVVAKALNECFTLGWNEAVYNIVEGVINPHEKKKEANYGHLFCRDD